jgi:hypothetical protein
MPLSDFVGLVPRTLTTSPPRILPPTNSLPPRRWPAGRTGIARGESGADGDFGGVRNALSFPGREAPGLKENAGRAGDLGFGPSFSVEIAKGGSWVSMADRGLRPVAREKDEGAEEDDGRAGKTKGGFGGGSVVLGETAGLATDAS